MKFFLDTANLAEIEQGLRRGFARGVTTNPSILAKEPKCDFKEHVGKIIGLLKEYGQEIPLSVEVFTTDPKVMIEQADDFLNTFKYENLNIKVPVGWNELEVIYQLRRRGIRVNCTCCMNFNQAAMAASAGANYVSLFYGRIRDVGYDAFPVVKETRELFERWDTDNEIIVGSIRHIHDINDAFKAGADIVTVPPAFWPKLTVHPKTDEAVNQFVTDFANWLK